MDKKFDEALVYQKRLAKEVNTLRGQLEVQKLRNHELERALSSEGSEPMDEDITRYMAGVTLNQKAPNKDPKSKEEDALSEDLLNDLENLVD